jgi:hypothetical protein
MKAVIRAEQDYNYKAQEHQYEVGQQIWLDECNFLSKNIKLAPFVITKVRDHSNIRIKLNRKEINVNVNRIKPFIAFDTNIAQPQKNTTLQQPEQQPQHTKEQPWIQVECK